MKFVVRKKVGYAPQLVPDRRVQASITVLGVMMFLMAGLLSAQSMYKYRGDNGEWIYADRPQDDRQALPVRDLGARSGASRITVTNELLGRTMVVSASNDFNVPVQMALDIRVIRGLEFPHPDNKLLWVLSPRSKTVVLRLEMLAEGEAPYLDYAYEYLAGEPGVEHRPSEAYRLPFAVAANFPVTQAYPNVVTHTTPDAYYAIDFAMPVGTDIFAARDGMVFDVESGNFRGGLDADVGTANLVRILHDDGTYAVYAHLNRNSIRVAPGDFVQRGQYIAESGNSGLSSGPHLHFVVLKNGDMKIESVPVRFTGIDSSAVIPSIGQSLIAY